MKRLSLEATLLIITLIITISLLFLLRFELVSNGSDGKNSYKLDRWTGKVYYCDSVTEYTIEIDTARK
jgi:hypothetical protein